MFFFFGNIPRDHKYSMSTTNIVQPKKASREQSINYFDNMRWENYFRKIEYNKSNFVISHECQYNLSFLFF